MRVNIGGDSGRDDYGLPPVDIEIPDDARELDRDVHAYYRELRAQRRRMLARRLYAPLSRDGMVLPLLAGCLALTLLAGTLLTVLTTGQGAFTSTTTTNPGTGAQAKQPRPRPNAGSPGGLLPTELVIVNGVQQPLRNLQAGALLVLALIPPSCHCRRDVQRIALLDQNADADTYLVGWQATVTQLIRLSKQVGLGVSHAVADTMSVLPGRYHPAILTAVLVRADGTIARFVAGPAHNSQFTQTLRSLSPAAFSPASTKALPRRAGAGPAVATTTTLATSSR
jgi:hypothetical protein